MANFVPINLIISLLFLTSIIGIGIYIQVKLSRHENKYLGLILPIISFLLSILIVLSMSAFTLMTSTSSTSDSLVSIEGTTEESIDLEEEEIKEEVIEEVREKDISSESVIAIFFVFLIANIPTAILGGIYVSERNKISVKRSIDKMRINDL